MNRITMLEEFSGAALPPNAATEFEAVAKNVISSLRRAIVALPVKVRTWQAAQTLMWPLGITAFNNTANGILSTVPTWTAVTDRLERNISDVITGETAPHKWLAAAEMVHAGITSAAADINEGSYFRFLATVFADAAKKIERIGSALEQGLDTSIGLLKYVLPGVLIAGAAIVLLHVNTLARAVSLKEGRGLSGHRKYRRRKA